MRPKAAVKLAIDAFMTVALLVLVGYQFWGDETHEWVGAGMFVLFITHHILNFNWHKSLFRGRYTAMRVLMLVVNILLTAAMLSLMYSGIVLSRHVFSFLPIDGGMALARRLHIPSSFWGFVLMSIHIGLHWGMIIGRLKKRTEKSKRAAAVLFAVGLCIAIYGVIAFIRRDIGVYMFMRTEFVFMDYNENPLWFYLDYIAVMGLFIFAGHYLSGLLKRLKKRKES